MRDLQDISFQAWDTENEIMFTDSFEVLKCMANMEMFPEAYVYFKWRQFTGLLDKNGKGIYEGDVVRLDSLGLPPRHSIQFGEGSESDIRVVAWIEEDAGFGWQGEPRLTGPCLCETNKQGLEVIGNIYQTPELIK